MVALLTAILLFVPAQGEKGKGKGKKKNEPKEIEDIDPNGRFEGGIIDQSASWFLWLDGATWHLRTGSTNRKTNFNGSIKVKNGTVAACYGVGLDKGRKKAPSPDQYRVNGERSEITFTFVTAGKADGINFKIKGDDAILEFSLSSDGPSGPRRVKIGKEKQNPSGMPFRLKVPPPEDPKSKKAAKKEDPAE